MSRHFYRKVKVKKTVPTNKTESEKGPKKLTTFSFVYNHQSPTAGGGRAWPDLEKTLVWILFSVWTADRCWIITAVANFWTSANRFVFHDFTDLVRLAFHSSAGVWQSNLECKPYENFVRFDKLGAIIFAVPFKWAVSRILTKFQHKWNNGSTN